MKWKRKITSCIFQKKDPCVYEPTHIRVYVPSCGWGILKDFTAKGDGYIKFDNGSGSIVRNWYDFLSMVEIIDTGDMDED